MTHRDPIAHVELRTSPSGSRLNWLRAAVLGANDGIVSVASVILGVAGATDSSKIIFTAGVAALVAGALSMAVGEYVSVSAQRDAEIAAKEFNNLTNPFHAAYASGAAFFFGAIIPIFAIIISPASFHVAATFASVILALIITGMLSAYVGGARKFRATFRVVLGGALAMIITYGVGKLFGVIGI
jgi:VIT1/CCC1 family predicted Fe2+/Mn2+ transporter